jgi:DNA-3-methyladenine glycosylase I
MNAADIDRLMANPAIVRHRGKIEATIHNAKRALKLLESQTSLASYLWQFEPAERTRPIFFDEQTLRQMTDSPESIALSKDLKARGWKYVGPTTMYALMQAMGLVNDHETNCATREKALMARKQLGDFPV